NVGQRKNPLWSAARKHRITASNFGAVLGAIKRNSFTSPLQKRLLSAYNLEAIRSISWGINHEIEAIKAYNETFGTVIEETGTLHVSGVLGASPDGIIKPQKCIFEEDNSLTLRKDHDYYHQIPSQLHITNKTSCDLVIWTCQDVECIRITRDVNWIS
ncbi:uncharacterized protein LOC130013550, partial [Patella vulgata]|uniref:uncharacterized protein LOC130013550 n=1 Tax=Patella vulgata TaxID=6465 RepID=UPI0024A973E3